MFRKKTAVTRLLSVGLVTLVFTATAKEQAKPSLSKTEPSSSNTVQSIAKPNWWVKPSTPTKTFAKMPKQQATQVSNQREPLSNFIKMANNDEWKKITSQGIASAKYELAFEGKGYELSIIRMNAKVPLKEVISIWQNKVGLVPKSPTESRLITTKKNQQLELIPLIGEQKTILLAVHKGQRYTFFRLLSNHKIEEKVTEKFKDFLMDIEILK